MQYCVITPAKNEEKYISFTLESMINQTIRPLKWIIVDDGSTDNTLGLVAKYQLENTWIEVVSIDNSHEKKLYGSKVIRAFNVGLNLIKDMHFDFIVKLDADLSFPVDYFEAVSEAFATNEKLGICGGYICEKESDFERKSALSTYVQGAVKSLSANCFKEIGGFAEENGWDGLDQLKAKYLGWEVRNIPIVVMHHRIQASDYKSLQFFYNNGLAHYRIGNDLLLTIIRTLVKLSDKPYLLASLSYLRGYLRAFLLREPKLVDAGLAKFIRAYHYKRLMNFKK